MRAVVALVGRLHLLAVIGRLVVVERGHDVPRRAAARQVIERRPQPRGMERMLMAHRVGGAEPDMRGRGGHERQQRDGIVLGRLGGVADGRRQRAGKGVGDVVEVGEEHHVELAALADPGDVLVELGPGPVVAGRRGARMPPHRDAVVGRAVHQELRQVHHGLGHLHGQPHPEEPRVARRLEGWATTTVWPTLRDAPGAHVSARKRALLRVRSRAYQHSKFMIARARRTRRSAASRAGSRRRRGRSPRAGTADCAPSRGAPRWWCRWPASR